MKKILSSFNNKDSLWLRFNADKASLDALNDVLEIYSEIEDSGFCVNPDPIQSLIKSGCDWLYFVREGCGIYFIVTEKAIHAIVRREGAFETIRERILNRFQFVNSTP